MRCVIHILTVICVCDFSARLPECCRVCHGVRILPQEPLFRKGLGTWRLCSAKQCQEHLLPSGVRFPLVLWTLRNHFSRAFNPEIVFSNLMFPNRWPHNLNVNEILKHPCFGCGLLQGWILLNCFNVRITGNNSDKTYCWGMGVTYHIPGRKPLSWWFRNPSTTASERLRSKQALLSTWFLYFESSPPWHRDKSKRERWLQKAVECCYSLCLKKKNFIYQIH